MPEEIKNYGLDIERELNEQSPEDWVFGSSSPAELLCLTHILEDERAHYLPVGEVQKGIDDMMDCASRGPLNILETKFNWLLDNGKLSSENVVWLSSNGYINPETNRIEFSDAFVAINSNTTRYGNSLKAPLDAIHTKGLVPKRLLPLEINMHFEDYHNPRRITPALKKLGEDFLSRFTINYERVFEEHFSEISEKDMINVAGYAWPNQIDGEYRRTGNPPNHCFILFDRPEWYIFDNYLDTDHDFIKKLAKDYDFLEYGYRVLITWEGVPAVPVTTESSWWARIFRFFFNVLTAKTV